MRVKPLLLFLLFAISATAKNASDETADSLLKRFHQYYDNMHIDSAMMMLDSLIAHHQERHDIKKESLPRWNKIAVLNNAGRYEQLVEEAAKQREWFANNEFWDRYYQCWQRICSGNQEMGRLQTALREAKAMKDDAQQRNNNVGRAMAYKQMGTIYLYIQQLDQSEEAYRKSVKLLKEESLDNGILCGVYEGLCEALLKQEHYDQALIDVKDWLAHLKVLEKEKGLPVVSQTYIPCYITLCSAYIGKKDYNKALAAIAKAQEYYEISKSVLTEYDILEMRTRLALAQGNPQQAIAYGDSAVALGVGQSVTLKEDRAEAMQLTGDSEGAAKLYRALYEERDSAFSHDMQTQLNELNTIFHVDELRDEQRKTRELYTIIIFCITVIAFLTIILLSRRSARRMADKNRELAEKNAALEIANAKAEESSKMKTEFIRNISHEIRTPLNILNGFTQILSSPDADTLSAEEKESMRHQVEDNAMSITSLINNMLEFSDALSRTVIERTDTISPEEIANTAIDKAKNAFTDNVNFSLDISDDARTIQIQTHKGSAAKALAQIIENGFKFTSKGEVRLSVSLQPSEVCFVIEDTGIGIPADKASVIFDDFVQIDNFSDGTGIGLPMARNIAQRLGGDIRLDPEYNNGARFILTLPR
jgi:signal transduction histidine kinase